MIARSFDESMKYCLMYDEVFYNICSDPYREAEPVTEVNVGDFLITFFDEEEAGAAKMAAYSRRIEYEEANLPIPELLEIISLLQVTPIDEELERIISDMFLEMVPAYE